MPIKNYGLESAKWGERNGLFGPNVFHRYIMLLFLDELIKVTDEFVFKGGNLLWHYLKTPRETADLDFITLTDKSHEEIRGLLEKVKSDGFGLEFKIKEFNKVDKKGHLGARVKIQYKTPKNDNSFKIDIVYAIPTEIKMIKSTIQEEIQISASCLEEIITDKLKACYDFKSGNTRMKDYDDLWRISQSGLSINKTKIKELSNKKKIFLILDPAWINQYLVNAWIKHIKKYKDLPKDLKNVFDEINNWLKDLR